MRINDGVKPLPGDHQRYVRVAKLLAKLGWTGEVRHGNVGDSRVAGCR